MCPNYTDFHFLLDVLIFCNCVSRCFLINNIDVIGESLNAYIYHIDTFRSMAITRTSKGKYEERRLRICFGSCIPSPGKEQHLFISAAYPTRQMQQALQGSKLNYAQFARLAVLFV